MVNLSPTLSPLASGSWGGGGGSQWAHPLRPKNRWTGPDRRPAQLSRRRGMANVMCTVMEVWRGAPYCLPWQELLSPELLKFFSCWNLVNSQIKPGWPGRCKKMQNKICRKKFPKYRKNLRYWTCFQSCSPKYFFCSLIFLRLKLFSRVLNSA